MGALEIDLKETFGNIKATVVDVCAQLVTVDKLGNVQLVHETAREFLLSNVSQSEFGVDKVKANTQIAEACLEYLCGREMRSPRSTTRVSAIPAAMETNCVLSIRLHQFLISFDPSRSLL